MGLRGNITAGVIVLACLVITGSAATSVNARAAGLLGVPVTGGGWGESGLTGGGFENQIVVSPTDPAHLLLASDIGGIQYSDDGGRAAAMFAAEKQIFRQTLGLRAV